MHTMSDLMPPTPAGAVDAPAAPPGRGNFTAQDWIDAALAHLVNHPIDAVRVDVLARQMQVTRGSFYWHFTDREDLLQRLLVSWKTTTTEQLIARQKSHIRAPDVAVLDLLQLPAHGRTAAQASKVEMAIREWARRDDKAREVLREVDSQRLGYMRECFEALGHSAEEARHRAFTLYACIISDTLLVTGDDDLRRDARLSSVHALLISPPGSAA